jgi:hypothetical protein
LRPQVKRYVDPATNLRTPYTPQGRFIHVPLLAPLTGADAAAVPVPWWRNDAYVVGTLSAAPRKVKIVNTLTSHAHVVEYGGEVTVAEMQRKFLHYNAHGGSYTWKALVRGEFRPLDLTLTLQQNGVVDDAGELDAMGLDADADANLPTLLLVFNDDLTEA